MKLYESGDWGYAQFRIPCLLATSAGELLALCEARSNPRSDSGRIRILLRGSRDGGQSWSAPQVVAEDGDNTVGNPCLVEHRPSKTLQLIYNGNDGSVTEADILAGHGARRVYRMESRDGGRSWRGPWDITQQATRPGWTWYACGPCHGLCLPGGRLVIPCNHGEASPAPGARSPYAGHLILSDDGGATWRVGAVTGPDANEATAACLEDGRLYVNLRSYRGHGCRLAAWSGDGGEHLSPLREDLALREPVCQGSALSWGGALLFLNPDDDRARRRLTLKFSLNGGLSWAKHSVIRSGPAAYSDMAVLNGCLFMLFEAGEDDPYSWIELTSCPLTAEGLQKKWNLEKNRN